MDRALRPPGRPLGSGGVGRPAGVRGARLHRRAATSAPEPTRGTAAARRARLLGEGQRRHPRHQRGCRDEQPPARATDALQPTPIPQPATDAPSPRRSRPRRPRGALRRRPGSRPTRPRSSTSSPRTPTSPMPPHETWFQGAAAIGRSSPPSRSTIRGGSCHASSAGSSPSPATRWTRAGGPPTRSISSCSSDRIEHVVGFLDPHW